MSYVILSSFDWNYILHFQVSINIAFTIRICNTYAIRKKKKKNYFDNLTTEKKIGIYKQQIKDWVI